MEPFSSVFLFVFTILFMLLGPLKLIPTFAGLMQGADSRFKKAVAIQGTAIAVAICAFVVLAGGALVVKYRISVDAVRISGGLVLMLSALKAIFQNSHSPVPSSTTTTASQLAASPVAVPCMVPPAGIAAILIMMLLAPQYPGMLQSVIVCLGIMMVLDFLVMFFIDQVMKTPGLMVILFVLGSALVFVQVCLAVQILIIALKNLGVIQV